MYGEFIIYDDNRIALHKIHVSIDNLPVNISVANLDITDGKDILHQYGISFCFVLTKDANPDSYDRLRTIAENI